MMNTSQTYFGVNLYPPVNGALILDPASSILPSGNDQKRWCRKTVTIAQLFLKYYLGSKSEIPVLTSS
jgi:tryptophanyl-tRNA synthetase